MSILISFLNLMLYIAIICFVAYVIVWVIRGFFTPFGPTDSQVEPLQPYPPGPPSICKGC